MCNCVLVFYTPNQLLDLSCLIETFCRNLENKHRGSFSKNTTLKKKEQEVIQNFRHLPTKILRRRFDQVPCVIVSYGPNLLLGLPCLKETFRKNIEE